MGRKYLYIISEYVFYVNQNDICMQNNVELRLTIITIILSLLIILAFY